MAQSFTKWLKRNLITRYMMSGCPDEQKCLETLALILDQECPGDDKDNYYDHIDMCWTCFQNYNLESAIRELIKTKVENRDVPLDLEQRIRAELEQSNNR